MTAPRIEIDLDKILHNAGRLVRRLGRRGIGVTGVTKAVCGRPDIARAMLDGGVAGLADSRIENVERMRRAGIESSISLIRAPMLSQADRVAQGCAVSFNTELDAIHRLARSALGADLVHGVILMVEMGDLREGIMPEDLAAIAHAVTTIPGISLKGIGANFACLNATPPHQPAMTAFSDLASAVETACGLTLATVSGGNSASLPWIFGGGRSGRVNDLRLGEAILLGVDPLSGRRIEGLFTDAFTLVAEVIESKVRPAIGASPAACPGIAHLRVAPERRLFRQSLLAIGRQDTDIEGLSPPAGLTLIGATSDHLVLDAGDVRLAIGAEVALQPNYSALMRAMNAPNVQKTVRNRNPPMRGPLSEKSRPRVALA